MTTPASLSSGLIKGRYKVIRKIGQGAFGEIFQGRNVVTNEDVAIKVEKVDSKKQVLKLEVAVLKKLQPCEYVVPFVTCGRHGDYNYLVMELLGENISDLRRRQASGRFSVITTCRLALQMLKAIEMVHDLGFLHRDIKPSNFAVGLLPTRKNRVYMIDFGLSRRFVLPNGKVRPPRDQSGFRGTARYASINAHLAKDLARRDDLWSLLYMLIEFVNGILPWRRIKDKDQVGDMKIRCNTPELVADLPPVFLMLWEHLQTLRYEDKPNYQALYTAFEACIVDAGGSPDSSPFDWECSTGSGGRVRPLPRLQDLALHVVVANVDRIPTTSMAKVPPTLKAAMVDLVCLLRNNFVPEEVLLKLVDARTKSLDLSRLVLLTPATFSQLIERCAGLEHLLMGQVNDGQIAEVVKRFHGLRELALEVPAKLLSLSKGIRPLIDVNAATLTSVKLTGTECKDKVVEHVLHACPLLEALSLDGCRKVKGTAFSALAKSKAPSRLARVDLSHCELNKSGLKAITKACSTFTALRLAPLVTSFSVTAADVLQIMHRAPLLTSLDINHEHVELDSLLIEISKGLPHIQHLRLEGCGISDFGIQNMLQLKELAFQCGDGISDASLHQVSKSCTSLTRLQLRFVTRANRNLVSDHAVRALLSSCANMVDLQLNNCLLLALHCFPEEATFEHLTHLNLEDCLQVDDVALERFVQSAPNLLVLRLDSLNNLTSMSLMHVGLWCLLLERLSLCSCACFEDEAIHDVLRRIPRLLITLSRFPSPDLKRVDMTVHRSNIGAAFAATSNSHRGQALEKKRLYGLVG